MDESNFMNQIRGILDRYDRHERQKTWNARLLTIKGKGLDLDDMCAESGAFDPTEICNAKSGRRILSDEKISDFEALMAKNEKKLGIKFVDSSADKSVRESVEK